ncbi:MAG TPA: glycogen debranching protein GlgX [Steroidobacteraceae bacterium]|nr:glycogen debranching protein GlgX [Steroidobacteraceae bacterium]
MKAIQAGSPRPLGATWNNLGVNFALSSSHATRVEVCLFDAQSDAEIARYDLPARTGDVWHGLLSPRRAGPGTHYAFCVHGPDDPQNGHRFDATVPLIDPYARELSARLPLRSRVIDHAFHWAGDRPPTIPWRDSIIYELHVKGFTRLHPAVPEKWRGKYLGLSVAPVIEHLKSIGVTAVELLPCQAFVSEPFLRDRKLTNYWGYNSVAWFAPANEYAVSDAVAEFKTMVRALHSAGIEVILDVVFNHTAEGNESGPLLSLRGIDNSVYYRLNPADLRLYENLTGTGNTVNCEHPRVRALIVDCLKYWVEEMHVDGFRFDLATVLGREAGGFNAQAALLKALRAEPALDYVKLIAEPWDVGMGGYQLGRFPLGWSEWNDRYRDATRAFWRGDAGKIGEFAERLAGSSDVFRHNGRKPTAGINFVTAHDGMTLNDLVSYNQRHNELNLENNTDGHSNELSWNCGIEGPTDDPAIVALRKRQMRNFLATLFLSQGVPMLQAGDEFARTQRGNNNAYCQDNEISWVDWRLRSANYDLLEFVRLLARLRRLHVEFRRETFLKGAASRAAVKDVTWLNVRGTEMTQSEWQDSELRMLGMWFGEHRGSAEHLLLLVNSADSEQHFGLPAAPADGPWICLFDTASEGVGARSLGPAQSYALKPRSVALLEC